MQVAARPVALIQIFDDRGHSVSLVYPAVLRGEPGRLVDADAVPGEGDLRWFGSMPGELYPSHLVYRDIVDALVSGRLGEGISVFTQHTGERDAAQPGPEGAISADASLTEQGT